MEFRYYISNKWTKEEVAHVMNMLEFCANFLKVKGVTTVKLINQDSVEATTDKIRNKRFELRFNRAQLKTLDEILTAIAHEMTHIKQFQFDGLNLQTKTFKNTKCSEDYWFTPWEMEARAMEDPLVIMYKREYN